LHNKEDRTTVTFGKSTARGPQRNAKEDFVPGVRDEYLFIVSYKLFDDGELEGDKRRPISTAREARPCLLAGIAEGNDSTSKLKLKYHRECDR
jgi:hypothetical protein